MNYEIGNIIVLSFYTNELMQREINKFAQGHLTSNRVRVLTQAVWARVYTPYYQASIFPVLEVWGIG